MLEVGQKLSDFTATQDDGVRVRLSDFLKRGPVVLYFYPKDDTPGCTKEACNFRDEYQTIQRLGAEIVGVSPDDVSDHQKFKAKFELPFPLLCDVDQTICAYFGVWKEKSMYGRTYMGVERSTFLIGQDGRLLAMWPKVKVEEHAQEVIQALRALAKS